MTVQRRFTAETWPWIAFVVAASLALSRAFACATPFAALATLAAFTLRSREATALVAAAWLGNQLIGFGLMHYPRTASTLEWGLAIGVAASAALGAATALARVLPASRVLAMPATLLAALAAYELILLLATAFLPSGPGAFAPEVLLRISAINAIALGLLVAVRQLAAAAGLAIDGAAVSLRG